MLDMDEIGSPKNTSSTFGVRYGDYYTYRFRDSSGKIVVEYNKCHLVCCDRHKRFFSDCIVCQKEEAIKVLAKPLIDELTIKIDHELYITALKKVLDK